MSKQYTLTGEQAQEYRWYKGKYKCRILIKSPKNHLVEALEEIPIRYGGRDDIIPKGGQFSTIPRLLWKKFRT